MKKILSIVAAAVIALSFNACKGKNDPDNPKNKAFQIEVSDVKATSATVKVTPKDTTVYYYFDVVTADQVAAGYTGDSLAADMKAAIDYYGYKFPYYLSQGADEWTFEQLLPETEYVAFAVQIDSTYSAVGEWTTVKFTTTKLEIVDSVDVKAAGVYYDLTDYEMGSFLDIPVGTSGAVLEFSFPGALPVGPFTEAALDPEYGAWYIISETEGVSVLSCALTGTLVGTEYSLKGEAVALNGVKYIIDSACSEGDINSLFGAPRRKAPKFGLRK